MRAGTRSVLSFCNYVDQIELMLEIFNQWRKQLRIRYLGLIEVRRVRQFCFHDLETNTNFRVPRLEQLEQTLAVHRQSPNMELRQAAHGQD